jgi:hypothetical protein
MHMVAIVVKPRFVFSKRPRRIWKPCWKPGVQYHQPFAINSFSLLKPWGNILHGTVGSLIVACVKLAVNFYARAAVIATIPIHFGPTD